MSRNAVRKHPSKSIGESKVTKATAQVQPVSEVGGNSRPVPTATAPTELPGIPSKDGESSMPSSSKSEPKASNQPSTSTSVARKRNRQSSKRKGKVVDVVEKAVSAEGPSSLVEQSTAKSEASPTTTIPPVSQKNTHSPRKASHPSSSETMAATDATSPSQTNTQTRSTTKIPSRSLHPSNTPAENVASSSTVADSSAPPVHKRKEECIRFLLGRCQFGDKCRYLHIVHDPSECLHFKLGSCTLGPKCPRPHVPVQEECRLSQRGQCRLGERCRRRHTPSLNAATATVGNVAPEFNGPDSSDDGFDTSPSSVDSSPPSTPPVRESTFDAASKSSINAVGPLANVSPPSPNTISIQRPVTRDESGKEVCRNFLSDHCRLGARCPRSHPPRCEWHKYLPRSDELCEAYVEGRCFLGESCWHRHPSTANVSSTSPATMTPSQTHLVNEPKIPAASKDVDSKDARQLQPSKLTNSIDPHASSVLAPRTSGQLSKGKKRMSENSPLMAPSRESDAVAGPSTQPMTKLDNRRGTGPTLAELAASLKPAMTRSTAAPSQEQPEICLKFLQGQCKDAWCKSRHEALVDRESTGEGETDRLISLLRQSADDWHAKSQALQQSAQQKTSTSTRSSRARVQPDASRSVPNVPPGLPIEKNTSRSSVEARPNEPSTMALRVLDAVQVTFGPGFAVQEVITGFESRVVILKNVPSRATPPKIKTALAPFGEVVNVQFPEGPRTGDSMTLKVTFADHKCASSAASALDGCSLFGVRLAARLASQQSTSLGKGVVRDGDVLLEFPAPGRSAFVGYSTLEDAKRAVQTAFRAQMGDSILSASIYAGLPMVGRHNVRFHGLPPDTETVEMEAFGPNTGVMFTRANYMSLDDALKRLQAQLETYGELISVKVISPPFENQTVRAWAHFSTAAAADEACKDFNHRRPWYFGRGRVKVQHVTSITYQLPNRVFDVLADTLRYLRSCVYTTEHRCDITFHTRSRAQTGSVGVKLSAEALPTLTRLKTSIEGILRGEIVRFDKQAAWDSFFARASGAAFIAALEKNHPMVIIQIDTVKSCIRLFGSPSRTWRARSAIQDQMVKLRMRKVHSIPLNRSLLGLFIMNSDLLKLQQELSPENVYIDPSFPALKVRGNKDAVQVANLIVQRVRREHMQGLKQSDSNSCPICLDKVSLPVTLDCGHTWCKNCLTGYLLAAIDTKSFPLNCLGNEARCTHQIPLQIAHRLLPSEDFQRLTHASFLAYIHSRPSEFHYCPTPDCQQVYRTAPPDTVLQCPSCLIRICGNCHIEHHEGKRCPDPEKEELRLFEEWSTGRDVKRCPECKTFIEREAGCNHMTCTRCRTHICWVCLETFGESEACYDHMRKVHGGIGL